MDLRKEINYYGKFKQQWNYIQTYMLDHTYGDWYSNGLDIDPKIKTALKGHIWKGNYHQLSRHCETLLIALCASKVVAILLWRV